MNSVHANKLIDGGSDRIRDLEASRGGEIESYLIAYTMS
jgi:hypothetical protein